ncbi:SEC-C domain-containing protein [Nocardiopsis alba]|uniref:SEC-C domain-containing protein n=1 Tax=Nocardiopsis alba TaxID=53437 RepID=UPI0035E2CC7A
MTEPAFSAPLDPGLVAAILDTDLPQHVIDDLAQSPDAAGEILLNAAYELRGSRPDTARRVLDLLRDRAPDADHRQYAVHMSARLLREEGRAAEADRLIEELMRPGVLGRPMAAVLADEFAEAGDLDRALYCYNVACRSLLAAPVELVEGMDPVGLLPLTGRARVRERLGLPADEHDRAVLAAGEGGPSLVEEMGRLGGDREEGDDSADLASRTRVVLTGEDRSYYEDVERGLRESAGELRFVVTVDPEEIDAHARDLGLDPEDPDTLRSWARTLDGDSARPVAWPPERNAACWCGSGRKYKKCCGSPAVR